VSNASGAVNSSVASANSQRSGVNQPRLRTYFVGNSVALIAGLMAAYFALLHGHSITTSTIKTGDFMAFYSGSQLLVSGHGSHLYDFAALGRLQTSLLLPLVAPHGILLPYLYPAYQAVALAPLGALPYTAAYAVWMLVNCFALVLVMFTLERYGGVAGRSAGLFRLAALCSIPVLLTLFNGQTSIVITALLSACLLAARSRRDLLAGAALACAMVKLPYVLPVLLVFVILRRWRLLGAFVVSACCLMLIPLPFFGLSIDQQYVRTLLDATKWTSQFGYSPVRNNSLEGFTQLLLPSALSGLVRIVLCLVAIVVLVASTRRSADLDLPFGLAILVALLVSPHVLAHDLTLLLIPIAVALRYRRGGRAHLNAILIFTYLSLMIGYWLVYAIPLQLSVVAMCALSVWLVATNSKGAPPIRVQSATPAAERRLLEATQ
jgi:hypothetical protein